MVGWHHRPDGHGFGWILGVGDGQGGMVFCGSWGLKESDTTEQLNNKLPSLIVSAFSVVSLRIHLTKLRSVKKSIVISFLVGLTPLQENTKDCF